MILGMGATELIVILLVALVVFGPKNLPKLGSAVGKTIKNVREGMEGTEDEAPEAAKPEVSKATADADDADADSDVDEVVE